MSDLDICTCDPGTGEVFHCDDPLCPKHGERNEEWGMDLPEPEVCVGCGNYFDYRGGNQLCWKCKRN